MTDRILVFIPCYNCANQVSRVLAQFQGAIAGHFAEMLVLDNGSSDGTVDAAIAAAPHTPVSRITIARNRANYNLGGSHKSAFAYAARNGFTHVVTLHGDDQGNIADLLPVLAADAHNRADAMLGARFVKGAQLTGYSRFRIFGNRVFNLIFSVAARRSIGDLGSGLNILAHKAFAHPAITRLPDDLHFNPWLLMDLIDRKQRVAFFPISWREDDQVSNVKMASQAMKTLAAAGNAVFRKRHFRGDDHRRVHHATYAFDTIASFENGTRV